MICDICGKEFQPSGHGKRQRYCSESCRNKAKYMRRKGKTVDPSGKRAEKKPVRESGTEVADLDRQGFERMMDGSMEDVLRRNRDRLQAALDDIATPANALPAISRQLIAVCERIESLSGGGLADLLDEESEVVDVGASIV